MPMRQLNKRNDPTEQLAGSSNRAKIIQSIAIVLLIAATASNIHDLVYPPKNAAKALPKAAYGSGYIAYVDQTEFKEYDFYIYEALRRYFTGARLIGFDAQSIAFGKRSYGGFSSELVISYDPTITDEEARELRRHEVASRPSSDIIAAVVIAVSAPLEKNATAIVLRSKDGTRYFVSGELAPPRYSGIVNGN